MTFKGPPGPFCSFYSFTMGINPTDLGKDFIKKGMRLITQTSSDALLKKAKQDTIDPCTTDLWDPSTGPQEPDPSCND